VTYFPSNEDWIIARDILTCYGAFVLWIVKTAQAPQSGIVITKDSQHFGCHGPSRVTWRQRTQQESKSVLELNNRVTHTGACSIDWHLNPSTTLCFVSCPLNCFSTVKHSRSESRWQTQGQDGAMCIWVVPHLSKLAQSIGLEVKIDGKVGLRLFCWEAASLSLVPCGLPRLCRRVSFGLQQ